MKKQDEFQHHYAKYIPHGSISIKMLNCKLIYHDKRKAGIARGQAASLKCRTPVHRSGGEGSSGADGNIVLTGMQFHRCV